MKHKAPQFDLPGTEYVFNLSGEQAAPEASPGTATAAQDRTGELFPTTKKPTNEEKRP